MRVVGTDTQVPGNVSMFNAQRAQILLRHVWLGQFFSDFSSVVRSLQNLFFHIDGQMSPLEILVVGHVLILL